MDNKNTAVFSFFKIAFHFFTCKLNGNHTNLLLLCRVTKRKFLRRVIDSITLRLAILSPCTMLVL